MKIRHSLIQKKKKSCSNLILKKMGPLEQGIEQKHKEMEDLMIAGEECVSSRKERGASTPKSPPGRAVYKYTPNLGKRVLSMDDHFDVFC
jgi:hypothetical protein